MQLARVRYPRNFRLIFATALTFGLLISFAARASAQEDDPLRTASRQELDIVKVVLAQEKAWNAGDLDGYLRGYKDSIDTIFMGRQISRGYSQIAEDYRRNYPSKTLMGTLSFSELEAHPVTDTVATCLGRYHIERARKDGGSADGMFSLVLEKTENGWKIIFDHTS